MFQYQPIASDVARISGSGGGGQKNPAGANSKQFYFALVWIKFVHYVKMYLDTNDSHA